MTTGTAIVARMNVRGTVDSVRSRSPISTFRTVSVGKTANQIIRASWCLLGGGTRVVAGDRSAVMGALLVRGGW
jgi:hypothetical protein